MVSSDFLDSHLRSWLITKISELTEFIQIVQESE